MARYIVHTDEPSEIRLLLGDSIEVRGYTESGPVLFDDSAKATWKKWCPTPRLDPSCTEFYVDSDVFLVDDPSELRRFGAGDSRQSFLAFQEAPGSRHKVGLFSPRILGGIPPVNTGFLGQRPGADITRELLAEYQWWREHIPPEIRESHDDQGAVVAILARYYLIGLVELLPQDRYCIISPVSNCDKVDLENVVAVHATYSHHPAFRRFRRNIEMYMSGVESRFGEPPVRA
jgi:hypothetical protein